MMKTIYIKFIADIAEVEQNIEILTDDTEKQFLEKLNQGEYFTSMNYPCADVFDSYGEKVGIVTYTETDGNYSQFKNG